MVNICIFFNRYTLFHCSNGVPSYRSAFRTGADIVGGGELVDPLAIFNNHYTLLQNKIMGGVERHYLCGFEIRLPSKLGFIHHWFRRTYKYIELFNHSV